MFLNKIFIKKKKKKKNRGTDVKHSEFEDPCVIRWSSHIRQKIVSTFYQTLDAIQCLVKGN